MQAAKIKLADIFQDSVTLIVPVYQRNYDWRKEHCTRLFNDIKKLVESSQEHFLGAVVCQDRKISGMFNEHVIVDGQQRISSVVLLAKAIFDSTEDAAIRQAIQAKFIKPSIQNPKYKFKLLPTEYDREIFEKIMNGENLSEVDKNSKMYESYQFFKDAIKNFNCDISKLHAAIYNLQIVRILLENEQPQEIFESLNSTGKDLTETELIRNFLLMDLNSDVQENFYKKYWLPIERLLETSEKMEKFMVHYLISKQKSDNDQKIKISKNALYSPFKKYFAKNYHGDKTEQVEKFLSDLYHNAKFFSRLIFDENTNFESLSELEKKFYELIYLLKSKSTPIILMYLNEKFEKNYFDEKIFIKMTDALISLMCRARVCITGGIDEQRAGNILKRLEKSNDWNMDSFWRAITKDSGENSVPNNELFKQALCKNDFYNSLKKDEIGKYLLYKLDKVFGKSDNLPPYSEIKIHLIMPRTLNRDWKNFLQSKKDLDNHEFYFYSLGNLALTEVEIKNSAKFDEKRGIFSTSKFSFSENLKNYSDWTTRQIKSRTKILADKALEIWSIPEEYNKKLQNNENIFNLDSDFKNFTGTEVEIVSILGKEYKINYWIDLLRTIAQILYYFDKDIFLQSINNERIKKIFSDNPDDLTAPFKIDNNFYIGAGIDTKNCLKFAKTIVENFDRISDMNFSDEIWFTLKKSN